MKRKLLGRNTECDVSVQTFCYDFNIACNMFVVFVTVIFIVLNAVCIRELTFVGNCYFCFVYIFF